MKSTWLLVILILIVGCYGVTNRDVRYMSDTQLVNEFYRLDSELRKWDRRHGVRHREVIGRHQEIGLELSKRGYWERINNMVEE